MSKLDDIFDEMNMVEHGAIPDFLLSEDGMSISAEKTRKYLHRKFKRLMLELIGEDKTRPHNGKETFEKMTWNGVRNEVKDELRKKVEEL